MSGAQQKLAVGGLNLNVVDEGDGPPLILLHGFTGSTASMAGVAANLRDQHRTIRIDLVGHGDSDAPHDAEAYSMESCVDQIACAVDALGARPAHFIGYSLGGRVALALCARHPELAASIVAIGARAGIDASDERAERVRADCALADRIERDGVPSFVEHWMALPLFASQRRLGAAALRAAREQRLANRAHALALSLRGMGAGAQTPLGDRLAKIFTPVCLVVGEEDARFRAIAASMARALPRAGVEVVPEAGHAAHLENPAVFHRIVRRFIAVVEANSRKPKPGPGSAPPHAERNPSP